MAQSTSQEIASVVAQVVSRDPGWLKFYRETVDGLEVSEEALAKVKAREAQLATSAIAECQFMTRLWQGDVEGARTVLLDVLDDTALADAKLAGWYSAWLGSSYDAAGDAETAIAHYKRARSRLSAWLNVPFKSNFDLQSKPEERTTAMSARLREVNHHGPQALGDLIAKLRIQARTRSRHRRPRKKHSEYLVNFWGLALLALTTRRGPVLM